MKDILEAFGLEVFHAEFRATVEITDPEVASELDAVEGVNVVQEYDTIYTIESRV